MKYIYLLLLTLIMCPKSSAQESYEPSVNNLEARKWFQDARFGLFIHWGVYSVLGDGEWVMHHQELTVDEYEKLPGFFNPVAFNAEEWVSMVKNAGMQYITITTKHHDGFAMYDSEVSTYDIVDKTPYGQDIFRKLEQACQQQGIKLFAYYSQLDWHHPDYYPRGRTGRNTGRPERGNWDEYLKYQNAQIKEIASKYDIAGFWFDGWWDKVPKDKRNEPGAGSLWDLEKTYSIIHQTKDHLLIGNNHHRSTFPGEDFQMFEKDLPGQNTSGFGSSADDVSDQLPLETAATINHSWGFNLTDDDDKSVKELIHFMVKAAGHNSNFLLNVGPMPNGRIQKRHVEILKSMGDWMRQYGESIYGTRGGPVKPQSWGVSTHKNNTTYIHVLNPDGNVILLEDYSPKVKHIQFLDDNTEVETQQTKYGLLLSVPDSKLKEIDTIIEIKTK